MFWRFQSITVLIHCCMYYHVVILVFLFWDRQPSSYLLSPASRVALPSHSQMQNTLLVDWLLVPKYREVFVQSPLTAMHTLMLILYLRVWNMQPVFPCPYWFCQAAVTMCCSSVCVYLCIPVLAAGFSWSTATMLPGRALRDPTDIMPSCHIRAGLVPPCLVPFHLTACSMRAFMSTRPCHGFSYEFTSQAVFQGMFNLALGSNHFTEVEVMAMCLYTPCISRKSVY